MRPDPTVTALGAQGVEAVIGVIYPPQVALVGFGRVVERPWAVDGLLGVRPVVTAPLSADRCATDGAVGARCPTAVTRLLLADFLLAHSVPLHWSLPKAGDPDER
ncbi:2-oxo acid dehydrogenase subunit E2 [Streptomyces sp. NPDC005263]|uniref:2-oxo acid dehydrogenase subunit E2 n=1 Tax=Streptomyces sp. NPDC005263 TaxID=3364711 RepID=UPI00368E66AC